MAEKKEKAEAAPEGDAAPKSKKKLIMFIIIGVVVLVLVVGGGLAYFMMSKKKAADAEEGDEEQTEEVDKKKGKDKKDGKDAHAALPTFYKFDKPFTVRLASGEGEEAYLQVEAQFKLLEPTGVDAIKAAEPELKHKITLLLLARKASDLNTAKGVEELSWAIRDAANHTLHPPKKKKGAAADDHAATPTADVEDDAPVQAVLFTTFIIQ